MDKKLGVKIPDWYHDLYISDIFGSFHFFNVGVFFRFLKILMYSMLDCQLSNAHRMNPDRAYSYHTILCRMLYWVMDNSSLLFANTQSRATQQDCFSTHLLSIEKPLTRCNKCNLFLMPGPTPTLSVSFGWLQQQLSQSQRNATYWPWPPDAAVAVAVGLIRGLQAQHTLRGHCQSTASPPPGCAIAGMGIKIQS